MTDSTMPGRAAVALALVTGVGMAAGLGAALLQGDLAVEGPAIMALAWGRLLVLDVYAGMALFAGWIVWRERRWLPALAWIVLLAAIGNLVACIYVLYAWCGARGEGDRFWHGRRTALANTRT